MRISISYGISYGQRVVLGIFLLFSATFLVQAQQDTSLADLARQTRSRKQATAGSTNKAQELVEQMQQEQEESENAPTGFKTYNAGDYKLWVPFPYELEGRDNNGTVLAGSRLGVTNTEVMVGNPVPIPANLSDSDLSRLIGQLSQGYSRFGGCVPMKVGERRAYRCSLNNGSLLGHTIWGTIALVAGSNSLIPVMCVSPDAMNEHLVYGDRHATYQQKQAAFAAQAQRFQDEKTTAQVCDQIVYPSIRLKEDFVPSSAVATGKPKPAKTAPTTLGSVPSAAAAAPQNVAADNGLPAGPTSSVADIARQKKQAVVQPVKAKVAVDSTGDGSLAPPGFKSQTFGYCKSMGNCWTASVFVPTDALLLSSVASEFIFELPLGPEKVPDKVLLFFGPASLYGTGRLSTDRFVILWEEISDPEGWNVQRRLVAATHDEATVDGKPAILTHFELKRNDVIWTGRNAKVTSHEVEVVAGCMAPKTRFGDADQVCSALIDSLRFP